MTDERLHQLQDEIREAWHHLHHGHAKTVKADEGWPIRFSAVTR